MEFNEVTIKILFTHLDINSIIYLRDNYNVYNSVYYNWDINLLLKKVNSIKTKFNLYLDFYKHLPAQGSDEWLQAKKGNEDAPPTIGGSEIASIIGSNPHQRSKQIILNKLQLTKFDGNLATRWGNLLEPIVADYIDYVFCTETKEMGSIPGLKKDGFVVQSYSPDRIGIVSKQKLLEHVIQTEEFSEYLNNITVNELIVLFEIKCPHTRIPNGEVPKQYIPQPKLGACTLPIIDTCVFVDALFRKCKAVDFDFTNNFDVEFHGNKLLPENYTLKAIGVIGFYEEPEEDTNSLEYYTSVTKQQLEKEFININIANIYSIITICMQYTLNKNIIKEVIHSLLHNVSILCDNGIDSIIHKLVYNYIAQYEELNVNSFSQILRNVFTNRNNSRYCIYYPKEFLTSNNNPRNWLTNKIEEIRNYCIDNNYKFLGIMPWKLFNIELIPILKEVNFLENIKDNIFSVITEIQELKSKAKDMPYDSRADFYIEEIEKKYPTKRIKSSKNVKEKIEEKNVIDPQLLIDFGNL